MSLKPKLPFIIFALTILAFCAWSFPIVKNRYFQPKQEKVSEEISQSENSAINSQDVSPAAESSDTNNNRVADEDSTPQDDSETDTDANIANEDNSFLEILPSDCEKNCNNFDQPEDIQYCKQYCGLTTPKKSADGCDKFADLEKDYCLKDEAVQKKDLTICKKIADDGIRTSCSNRIAEYIMDSPQAQ